MAVRYLVINLKRYTLRGVIRITANLRMYVNELAFCISYCKANGDVEMERIYQEAYDKKSAQLAMLNDLNKGNL